LRTVQVRFIGVRLRKGRNAQGLDQGTVERSDSSRSRPSLARFIPE